MDKHIQLVGILNIVYRSLTLLGGFLLLFLASEFWQIFGYLISIGAIGPHEIPMELIRIVPVILTFVGLLVVFVSVLVIVAGVVVLKRREWGRVLLLVLSFFSLVRIPLGTALGIYSIWVLLNSDTIRAFNPLSKEAPVA